MDGFWWAIMIALIAGGLIFGFATRYIAMEKNKKNPENWFIIGFILGLIGLLIVAFSKDESKEQPVAATEYKKYSTPPSQKETIPMKQIFD